MKKLLDVLYTNDDEEIKEYLFSEGKSPKPICPIQFVSEEEINLYKEREEQI